jgi:hypothetical protein
MADESPGEPQQPGDPNDWLRYSGLCRREQRWMRRRQRRGATGGPPLFLAVCLIGAGILLFLNSIGILPIPNIWAFWPVIPLCAGLGKVIERGHPTERAFGILLVLFGVIALGFTLGLIRLRTVNDSWIAALVLIIVGTAALFKALESRTNRPAVGFVPPIVGGPDHINDVAILGSINRKLDTPNFQGGVIVAFMGNVETDLRRAVMSNPQRSATVEVRVTFGAVKIRIPEAWRVSMPASSILGNIEDKTIPPTTGTETPWLVITGYSVLSSVEIEN